MGLGLGCRSAGTDRGDVVRSGEDREGVVRPGEEGKWAREEKEKGLTFVLCVWNFEFGKPRYFSMSRMPPQRITVEDYGLKRRFLIFNSCFMV